MRMKLLTDYAAYLAVRVLICVVQALPLTTCEKLSRRLAWLCWRVLNIRRKVVRENLGYAFPEKSEKQRDAIALAMWEHLFLMVSEIAHAPRKLQRSNWREHSTLSSNPDFLRMLLDERPTVVISGHLGNFEIGGYLLALHGFHTFTIARPLDNPFLNRFVNEFRGAKGQYMLPKQGSGPQIQAILNAGGTLVLLGDQHAGRSSCWVDFFGRPASTHKAVAVFTLGSMAPTAVSACLRRAGPLRFSLDVVGLVDPNAAEFDQGTIPQLTQWYTNRLEELIRRSPEQYWWVHRRWKGSPEDLKKLRRERRNQKAA